MDRVLQTGDMLLGKYRVERVLGQGGMGIVVAARHVDLGQLFAIKCMLPEALAAAGAVERFLREARAAATLQSEHVAKVVDVGRLETGAPYMIMEHLSGSDLGEILRSRGALRVDEAVTYVLQACEALAEAHRMGIVHRDLKPANLFLTRRPNGSACIKILDFGISKQLGPEDVGLTKTGSMVGTPLYMSPEQMVSNKSVDPRSDVWAMGVVLYELCTGRVPFEGQSVTEIAVHVVQDEPTPASTIRPDLPRALDEVVARCLQKQPARRYESVDALAASLRPLSALQAPAPTAADAIAYAKTSPAGDAPVVTLQGSTVDSRVPGPRRRPLVAAAVAASGVLVALGLGGLWLSRGSSGAPTGPLPASTPTSAEPAAPAAPTPSAPTPPAVTPAPIASAEPVGRAGATAEAVDAGAAPGIAKGARAEKPSKPGPAARPSQSPTSSPPPKRETLF